MENLDFLIDYLIKENKNIKVEELPKDAEDKKRLYRSLCNIRNPNKISSKYIEVENKFLKNELDKKGVINNEDINILKKYKGVNLSIFEGDITRLNVDAIVNAANSSGIGCFVPCHNCIDNAIFSASGVKLRLECSKTMEKIKVLKTGNAIITKGYNLKSKYIIHTVGPIVYDNVTYENIENLKNCYINSLKLAKENGVKVIAFPCISTGLFKFPSALASSIALETVKEYLDKNENSFEKIIFNVFSKKDYDIYLKNIGEVYSGI